MDFKKVLDLEEKIMATWNTGDDIELLYTQMLDGPTELDMDYVTNVLLGLQYIHEMRCQQLWDSFEKVCEGFRKDNQK